MDIKMQLIWFAVLFMVTGLVSVKTKYSYGNQMSHFQKKVQISRLKRWHVCDSTNFHNVNPNIWETALLYLDEYTVFFYSY